MKNSSDSFLLIRRNAYPMNQFFNQERFLDTCDTFIDMSSYFNICLIQA